jgi:hypothetical protein
MTLPHVRTASGRLVSLLDPDPDTIDIETDVAGPLARIARFAGHTSCGPYSVAQHSVLGAEALLQETGRADAALAFLLHDAHEAYVGDISTPMVAAIDAAVGPAGGRLASDAIEDMKARFDAAIRQAVGCPAPTPEVAALVRRMDARMLAAEFRQLFRVNDLPRELREIEPVRLTGAIRPWPWPHAADDWLTCLRRWRPGGAR